MLTYFNTEKTLIGVDLSHLIVVDVKMAVIPTYCFILSFPFARQERYGEHPETVNILYLIGIIHEYRKDRKAAYQIYEQAFEMEEKLPHHNHSRSREKIRDRLQEMYRALKMKEEEVELQYKIEEITGTMYCCFKIIAFHSFIHCTFVY